MTNKAFVDTTVVTDALLGVPQKKRSALAALRRFSVSELIVYGIKEFKLGPLMHFNWFHKKLVLTGSLTHSITWLQRLSRTQQRHKTATAIQALANAQDSIAHQTPKSLSKKYGEDANLDKILFDETRVAVHTAIHRAWRNRRKITTTVTRDLVCYQEEEIRDKNGVIDLSPTNCAFQDDCCVINDMKAGASDLKKMRDAIYDPDGRREIVKRCQALRKIYRTPKRHFDRDDCRALGDAIFVYFAPSDSVLLTTNLKDFQPMAAAIGKKVESPN